MILIPQPSHFSTHLSSPHCPSTFPRTPPSLPPFPFPSTSTPHSGLGISTASVVRPYAIPPNRLIGLNTAGSTMLRSGLTASSRTQNRTPSTTASTPVFFPGVARLSNSCVLSSRPSTLKTASWTREHATAPQGAACRPESDHSDTP